jgi:hypothetical protein
LFPVFYIYIFWVVLSSQAPSKLTNKMVILYCLGLLDRKVKNLGIFLLAWIFCGLNWIRREHLIFLITCDLFNNAISSWDCMWYHMVGW